jgi:hypothetical protein
MMPESTISHRGVPLGTVNIGNAVGVVTVEFRPLPAFDGWRPLANEVGNALRAAGFFGRGLDGSRMPPDRRSGALDEGASWGRELELWTVEGEFVPTSFIEIAEVPDESPTLHVAWIGFQTVAASVHAANVGLPRSAPESGRTG